MHDLPECLQLCPGVVVGNAPLFVPLISLSFDPFGRTVHDWSMLLCSGYEDSVLTLCLVGAAESAGCYRGLLAADAQVLQFYYREPKASTGGGHPLC